MYISSYSWPLGDLSRQSSLSPFFVNQQSIFAYITHSSGVICSLFDRSTLVSD